MHPKILEKLWKIKENPWFFGMFVCLKLWGGRVSVPHDLKNFLLVFRNMLNTHPKFGRDPLGRSRASKIGFHPKIHPKMPKRVPPLKNKRQRHVSKRRQRKPCSHYNTHIWKSANPLPPHILGKKCLIIAHSKLWYHTKKTRDRWNKLRFEKSTTSSLVNNSILKTNQLRNFRYKLKKRY